LVSKTLSEVQGEKAFVFCDGNRAVNLYQLADIVERIDDGTFHFHVNDGRNDLAQWVLDVLEDKSLFHLLQHEGNKYWFVQKVRGHIKFLEGYG
jgi:hypothetical protein